MRQQFVEIEKPRAQAIVDIVVVVGDIVGKRRHLRLQRGIGAEFEVIGCIEFTQRPVRRGDRAVVLGQPFQGLPRQVEPVMLAIRRLDAHQRAQAIGIVVEPARLVERGVERLLPRMAKRRMTDIVRQRQRLAQILIEPEDTRDDTRDLGDFQAVGQAHAVMVAVGRDEDLGLVAQAAERDRMDDAVTIALIGTARPARAAVVGQELAPARASRIRCVRSEGQALVFPETSAFSESSGAMPGETDDAPTRARRADRDMCPRTFPAGPRRRGQIPQRRWRRLQGNPSGAFAISCGDLELAQTA